MRHSRQKAFELAGIEGLIWRTVGTSFREGDFDAITIASLFGPLEYLDHKGVRVSKALPDHTFATKEQKAARSL